MEDVARALQRAVSSVDQSYSERVEKAFEAGGDIQPRKSILSLLAKSDRREWRSADVIAAWDAEFGPRDAYQFLHVALGALLDEAHGRVLRRKGTRNRYVYQFQDPYIRPHTCASRSKWQTSGSSADVTVLGAGRAAIELHHQEQRG